MVWLQTGTITLKAVKCSHVFWVISYFSHLRLCVTLLTGSRQEYWSVLPGPLPGNLPHPGIRLHASHISQGSACVSLTSPTLAGRFFKIAPPGKAMLTGVIQQFHFCICNLEHLAHVHRDFSKAVKGTCWGIKTFGFKSLVCCLQLHTMDNYLTILCLGFLISKIEIIKNTHLLGIVVRIKTY